MRPQRPMRARILIVCEGRKTEPNYFNALKKESSHHVEVKCVQTKTAAAHVVAKAIDLKTKNPSYDRVWAVFDKDDNDDQKFNAAINQATGSGVDCAE